MRVIGLRGENFKKIKLVEVTPDANVNEITGGNEQGKTSLLDGLESVFDGEKVLKRTPKPIREGEDRAFFVTDLGEPVYDDQGNEIACPPSLIATRTFTAKGSYLKVENTEGAVFKSPQAIMDKLVGNLSFDPLSFSNQKDKDQLDTLLKLVQIPIDLDEWAAQRKQVYDERTVINREVAALEGQTTGVLSFLDNTPDEEQSAASVLTEQQAAQKAIANHREMRDQLKAYRTAYDNLEADRDQVVDRQIELRNELIRLKDREKSLTETMVKEDEKIKLLTEQVKDLIDPDLSIFQDRIAQVEQINENVRAKKQSAALRDRLQAKRAESIAASEKIVALDHQRAEALAMAKMPIDDLSFDDNGVTYKGIPFRQCSSEERLRVSVAMGMALNPKLRVMFIRDASLLDTKNREVIKQMARDNNYQFWMEIADDSGKVGLYFEDGEIVSGNKSPVPATEKKARKQQKSATAELEF